MIIDNRAPLVLIAGPCAIESRQHSLDMACGIKAICDELKIPLMFKSSFDKANRTKHDAFRGINQIEALEALQGVKDVYKIPVLTDVHLPDQCEVVSKYVDVLQIPAFLCRQTDLLEAAAKTGKLVNIKKGQFMHPRDMQHSVDKVKQAGNSKVIITERGTTFGYDLVNDFTGFEIMKKAAPLIFDATHSVKDRLAVPSLARAAVATGIAGLFMEVHEDPDNAPSDGPRMVKLSELRSILEPIVLIDKIVKKRFKNE